MKHFFTILLGTTLLFSCGPSMEERLIGTWENTSLDVTMKLADGRDSLMHIADGEWENVLNIKPIVTTYTLSGNFVSEYYNLEGKLIHSEQGKWKIRNDSLVFEGTNYSTPYKLIFEGEKARLISMLDWDQDGKQDDLYDGWQKKRRE